MSEYRIEEDRARLLIYTILGFIITIVLMIFGAVFYTYGGFLITFFAVTGMWFSVKTMCRYGSKLIKKTPVCEITKDQVIIHSLPGKARIMKYQEIREVKLIRDEKSVKLFFAGDKVEHPSGYYYAGAIYFFQRSRLDEVEKNTRACLEKHKVNVRKVEVNG